MLDFDSFMNDFMRKNNMNNEKKPSFEVKKPPAPSERRRFPRLQTHLAFQYRNLNNKRHSSAMKGALTGDISAGGARFITNDFFAVNTSLNVEFSLSSQNYITSTEARVVWVKKLPYNENFMFGLEFVNIEHDNKIRIIRYVNEHSQRSSLAS